MTLRTYIGIAVAVALLATAMAMLIALSTAMAADRDCSDFGSQASAQRFFLSHHPERDPHGLDQDPGRDNGLACEAKGPPYRGLLSINYGGGDFKGRLKAVTGSCERNRQIKVYKKRQGPDHLVGKDDTNHQGRYKVHEPGLPRGTFYARSKSEGNCLSDRSFTLSIRVVNPV